MAPPYAHMHCDVSSSALMPLMVTRVEPGVQGDSAGTHGMGTSTPAASVAASTSGLASDVHKPKDGIFSSDTSVITPAGVVAATSTLEAVNTVGATPNVQAKAAPVETWFATFLPNLQDPETKDNLLHLPAAKVVNLYDRVAILELLEQCLVRVRPTPGNRGCWS